MKLRTVNRLISRKNSERDKLARDIDSLRKKAVVHLQEIRKLKSSLDNQTGRADSLARELGEAQAQLAETVKCYRDAERELASYQPEPVPADESWLRGLPAKQRRRMKEGFLDNKVKEGAAQRNGHTQIALKCVCGLEFILHTWFPGEHGPERSYYCPECGEQTIGYLGERNVEHEIKDQMIRCGAKAISKSIITKNARHGESRGMPIRQCGETTIVTDVAIVKAELEPVSKPLKNGERASQLQ
jgi:hypothetical protein